MIIERAYEKKLASYHSWKLTPFLFSINFNYLTLTYEIPYVKKAFNKCQGYTTTSKSRISDPESVALRPNRLLPARHIYDCTMTFTDVINKSQRLADF